MNTDVALHDGPIADYPIVDYEHFEPDVYYYVEYKNSTFVYPIEDNYILYFDGNTVWDPILNGRTYYRPTVFYKRSLKKALDIDILQNAGVQVPPAAVLRAGEYMTSYEFFLLFPTNGDKFNLFVNDGTFTNWYQEDKIDDPSVDVLDAEDNYISQSRTYVFDAAEDAYLIGQGVDPKDHKFVFHTLPTGGRRKRSRKLNTRNKKFGKHSIRKGRKITRRRILKVF
jgi:hypothetical protein